MKPLSFDEAASITPTDDPYIFYTHLYDKQWSIGKAPHGGLLAALCLKAGSTALDHYQKTVMNNTSESWFPHPLTASLHFLRVAEYGKRFFQVRVQKASRYYAQAIVTMRSDRDCRTDDNVILMCMAWFGDLNSKPDSWKHEAKSTTLDMSKVTPFSKLQDMMADQQNKLEDLPLYKSIELRMLDHDDDIERSWLKFRDNRPLDDVWSLIFAVDALVPHPITILEIDKNNRRVRTGKYWCPTMSLDLIIHELPEKGNNMVYEAYQVVSAHNGIFEETCRTYAPNGRLLISGRQYAGIVSFERAGAKDNKNELRSKL